MKKHTTKRRKSWSIRLQQAKRIAPGAYAEFARYLKEFRQNNNKLF